MHVRGTEGEGVVYEGRVDGLRAGLRRVQQVEEVTEMAVTAAHTIARAVLIQYEHLSWGKPALESSEQTNDVTNPTFF